MKKIAVVGAGIAGLTSAYYLARKGYAVTVYEQERYPAMQTSFANGGQVSVSNSETWNTWSNVRKGIGWMFTKNAPLLIRPRLDWAMIKWVCKFLYYTATGVYRENTAWTIRAGIESRNLYKQIIQEEKFDSFDQSMSGILHFYKDKKYLQDAEQAKSLYVVNGCEWEMLSGQEVVAKDTALSNIKNVLGGAWTVSDWTGDIHKFCNLLAATLEHKYKVKFVYAQHVANLDDFVCYDTVVIANGVGSTALAAAIGDDIPVYPVKGYSVTINNVDPAVLPAVSLLDDQAKIVTSTLGNRFRVAGTAELTGKNYDIRRDRIEPLLTWVHENFPKISTHDYSSWACLRPMTPNMMPIIKQSKHDKRVFYHTGHGHLGWTLSPATATMLVDLIEKQNSVES